MVFLALMRAKGTAAAASDSALHRLLPPLAGPARLESSPLARNCPARSHHRGLIPAACHLPRSTRQHRQRYGGWYARRRSVPHLFSDFPPAVGRVVTNCACGWSAACADVLQPSRLSDMLGGFEEGDGALLTPRSPGQELLRWALSSSETGDGANRRTSPGSSPTVRAAAERSSMKDTVGERETPSPCARVGVVAAAERLASCTSPAYIRSMRALPRLCLTRLSRVRVP